MREELEVGDGDDDDDDDDEEEGQQGEEDDEAWEGDAIGACCLRLEIRGENTHRAWMNGAVAMCICVYIYIEK